MPRKREEYRQWQDHRKSLNGEYDKNWSDETKRKHFEKLKYANEQCVSGTIIPADPFKCCNLFLFGELKGRLEARERWGNKADDGHDDRIDMLQGLVLTLDNSIAHAEGRYSFHPERIKDVDPKLRPKTEEDYNKRIPQQGVERQIAEIKPRYGSL